MPDPFKRQDRQGGFFVIEYLSNNNNKKEYEDFVSHHPQNSFMQSLMWPKVKNGWDHDAVIVRNSENKIVGTVLVLIQKLPFFGTTFLYAPRGPVCDPTNTIVLRELTEGIRHLGKKYNSHAFKCDPDILATDIPFVQEMETLGYTYFKGGLDFDTIQPRFNYRLYFYDRDEEALFMNLTQKTRYNVRQAMKKGVTVEVCSLERLPDFYRLMQVTGERDGFSIRPISYFENMLLSMGEHCRLYMAFYEGEPISGAITTNYGGKACYVYGASDNQNRKVMPNYLLQWEMIRWAISTGCTVYDFQGISGDLENEENHLYGLYRFKRGFNGEVSELCGEFTWAFKPMINRAVDLATDLRGKALEMKKGKRE